MDYSKFLDDSFDAKDWINAAFRSNTDSTTSNDQFATTMVMKLQLLVQEVNNVIEESSQEVITNLPRVIRDIDLVKQETLMLHEQMMSVKHDILKVEQDTTQSMQTLLKLDTLKCRMEATSDALKEADNWTVLSSEIEDVIQSGDRDLFANKLVAMQQSLRLLVNVADYEDRHSHLESLKNRLESFISPHVITALQNNNQDEIRRFVAMFKSINRLPQMYKYYNHYHKNELVNYWNSVYDEQTGLDVLLSRFYGTLLSTIHTQLAWCNGVFEEPIKVVSNMITSTFTSLERNLTIAFTTYIDSLDDNPITALCALKKETVKFCQSVEKSFQSKADEEYLKELVMSIYLPYNRYMLEYKIIINQYLSQQLDLIIMEDAQYVDVTIECLTDSVKQVIKLVSTSDEQCMNFTEGFLYPELLTVFKSFVNNYTTQIRRIVTNLGERFQKNSDIDSWSQFSTSLNIIAIIGNFIIEIEDFDQVLVSSILTSAEKLDHTSVSPLTSPVSVCSLSEDKMSSFSNLTETLSEKQTAIPAIVKDVRSLSEKAHKLSFEIIFSDIGKQLHGLSSSDVWISQQSSGSLTADLPDFSLAPQEYITQIGQYVMTLPQYLEPYSDGTHTDLVSQKLSLSVASKYGKLPYTKQSGEGDEHLDILWLESISRATMISYCEEIRRIHEITAHATRQLITDIEYLVNVLEDLELEPVEQLLNIQKLLKVDAVGFQAMCESLKISAGIANDIKTMRNLTA